MVEERCVVLRSLALARRLERLGVRRNAVGEMRARILHHREPRLLERGKVADPEDERRVAQFDRRYAEKLALFAAVDAQQMAAALAMYPMLDDAMKRMQVESVKLDGTAVLTVMSVDAVMNAAQQAELAKAQQEQKAEESKMPRSLGGLAGRLGRRVIQKDEPAANATPGRANFMTVQHEVIKVSATASDADVQLPAGFRQK